MTLEYLNLNLEQMKEVQVWNTIFAKTRTSEGDIYRTHMVFLEVQKRRSLEVGFYFLYKVGIGFISLVMELIHSVHSRVC